MQKPIVTSPVLYLNHGIPNAAIVTRVTSNELVDIHVFEATGNSYGLVDVEFTEFDEDNKWRWPK